jgi:hypothetical protein
MTSLVSSFVLSFEELVTWNAMNPSSRRSFLVISYDDDDGQGTDDGGGPSSKGDGDDDGGGAGHRVLCEDDRLSSSTGSFSSTSCSLSSRTMKSTTPPSPSSRRGPAPGVSGVTSGDGGGEGGWGGCRVGTKDGDRRKKKDDDDCPIEKSVSDGGGRLSVDAVPGSWKRGSVVDIFLLLFWLRRNDLLWLAKVRTPPRPHEFMILRFPAVVRAVANSSAGDALGGALPEAGGVVPLSFIVEGGGCGGVASAGDFLLTRLTRERCEGEEEDRLLVDNLLAGQERKPNPNDGICVPPAELLLVGREETRASRFTVGWLGQEGLVGWLGESLSQQRTGTTHRQQT